MFDGIKVQQEILKSIQKYKNFDWYYAKTDNRSFVTNGFALAIIPNYTMYLSRDTITWKGGLQDNTIKALLNDDGMPNIDFIGIYEELDSGKKVKLCVFNNEENNEKMYVNKCYVDWFGNVNDLTFKGNKKGKRVFVYNAGELIGVIMMVRKE